MDLIRFESLGHDVTFSCNARGTRHGFAHDASLFIDNVLCRESSCHYINRTWECYRYQTVCLSCCNDVIANRMERIKRDYKYENGLSRIAGKHKEAVENLVKVDSYVILMKEIKKILNEKSF